MPSAVGWSGLRAPPGPSRKSATRSIHRPSPCAGRPSSTPLYALSDLDYSGSLLNRKSRVRNPSAGTTVCIQNRPVGGPSWLVGIANRYSQAETVQGGERRRGGAVHARRRTRIAAVFLTAAVPLIREDRRKPDRAQGDIRRRQSQWPPGISRDEPSRGPEHLLCGLPATSHRRAVRYGPRRCSLPTHMAARRSGGPDCYRLQEAIQHGIDLIRDRKAHPVSCADHAADPCLRL